jgi:hypothetical protein
MFDEKTEKILKHDSLAESEKILGDKHWSEFSEDETKFSMGKFMMDNEIKKDYLKSIKDTYWRIPWDEFISVIEAYGFKRAWSQIFIDSDETKTNKQEEEIIYYHKDKGLVLWAESYTLCSQKDINKGTVFSIADIEGTEEWWKYREGSSGVYDGFLHMDFDIREGVIHKIEKISNLKLLNKWNAKQEWMHFVNFDESREIYKDDNRDYKVTGKLRDEITQKKINLCCDEFQEIINGYSYLV